MTVPAKFTKASLRRAIDVAQERGLSVELRPDGTMLIGAVEKPSPPVQPDSVDGHTAVVDKWADAT